jgi:hypothetical protein
MGVWHGHKKKEVAEMKEWLDEQKKVLRNMRN